MNFTQAKPKKTKKKKSPTLEQCLQNHVCMTWDRMIKHGWVFTYAGDMNSGRRTPWEAQWAKATGLQPGEADLRMYLPEGELRMFELKGENGRISAAQKQRRKEMEALGHHYEIVFLETTEDAQVWAEEAVRKHCTRK